MQLSIRVTVYFILAFFLGHLNVQAATAPIAQDSYVADGNGQTANQNHGSKTIIRVANTGPKHGLLQFDLSAFGGTVTSANLTLNVTNVDIAGNVDFHVILAPWNENTVTFNTVPAFDPIAFDTLSIAVGDIGANLSIDITAIAQTWVNDPGNNHGLMLVTNLADLRFSSKEGIFAAMLDVVTDGSPPPPPPPPPGEELFISSVVIDFGTSLITITGNHFDNGTAPVVELGEFGTLASTLISPMVIEATLPAIGDGDYSLEVSTGPDDSQSSQYDLTVDAELTEAEVDAFVSDNGFSTGPHYTDGDAVSAVGPHTVDTDTIRSDAEILSVVGPHTVDTDTQLNEGQVDAFVANNNFSTGSHTVDTIRSDAEILGVVGPHTLDTDTTRTDGEILTVIGPHYTDAAAIAAVGPHTLENFGDRNTRGGTNALISNTTGRTNTAFGFDTLTGNTTGFNNTAIGVLALGSNTTGHENTATGSTALFSNIGGAWNTASGYQSMLKNTSGGQNTAYGWGSLRNNTTGHWNAASGFEALQSNTTGGRNTATGYQALVSSTTSSNNTASGYRALRFNTTGSGNTASGVAALRSNTVGENNTAAGRDALFDNSLGSNNTAVGFSAGRVITGSNNIAIGNEGLAAESGAIRIGTPGTQTSAFMAGILNTDLTVTGVPVVVDANGQLGTSSAPIGYTDADAIAAVGPHTDDTDTQLNEAQVDAFVANNGFSTGPHTVDTNTQLNEAQVDAFVANNNFSTGLHYTDTEAIAAVGPHTLESFAGGNTRGGTDALSSNTSGIANTAYGMFALADNITGNYNTANGLRALYENNGNSNTASGFQALLKNTGGGNTAVGRDALKNKTVGDFNIAVGYLAGSVLLAGHNNIAIGNQGAAGENSTVRIGTEGTHRYTYLAGVKGTDLTATGTAVVVDANGQLGITTAPIGYTDADAIAAVGAHTLLDQPAVEALGFVTGEHYTDFEAISAVAPHHTLDTKLSQDDVDVFASNLGYHKGNGTAGRLMKYTGPSTGTDSQIFDNGANIGMGTTQPRALLHLLSQGDGLGPLLLSEGSPDIYLETTSPTHYNWRIAAQEDVDAGLSFGSGNMDADAIDDLYTTHFTIKQNGNIGIGTISPLLGAGEGIHIKANTQPNAKVVLEEGGTFGTLSMSTASLGLYLASQRELSFLVNNQNFPSMTITTAGDVGISTATPAYKLHVVGTIGTTGLVQYSDRRWKKDIGTIPDALDKILGLRGVSFEWRADEFEKMKFESGKQLGLIAQEVEQVAPELVLTGRDGYKSVAYSNLTALLIEAVKEIDEVRAEQERHIKRLESRLAALESGAYGNSQASARSDH